MEVELKLKIDAERNISSKINEKRFDEEIELFVMQFCEQNNLERHEVKVLEIYKEKRFDWRGLNAKQRRVGGKDR